MQEETSRRRFIYIAGPMSGRIGANEEVFWAAEKELRNNGWRVINPRNNFLGHIDLPREHYMRIDLTHVLQADAVYMLRGWETSRGAKLELAVARQLGLDVLFEDISEWGGVHHVDVLMVPFQSFPFEETELE